MVSELVGARVVTLGREGRMVVPFCDVLRHDSVLDSYEEQEF